MATDKIIKYLDDRIIQIKEDGSEIPITKERVLFELELLKRTILIYHKIPI
jgi:hypothetical protein